MNLSPLEIMAPQLMWIDGRCYRVNPTNDSDVEPSSVGPYIENDMYDEDEDVNDDEQSYDIQVTENNRFKTSFHVANTFYAIIIGAKGVTKKRIEAETKSVIKVPKAGSTEGDIEVIGATRASVSSARRRIELIVMGSRHKQECTHFICVPISQASIKENYITFKSSILNGPSMFGLDATMFQDPNKLHLTIGVMALMDNNDRLLAGQLMQDCQEQIIRPIIARYGSSTIRISSVQYMNDDPSNIDVLYAKVDCEPLQEIADQMKKVFVRHGLMERRHDKVKLHLTLINSSFRQFDTPGEDQEKRPRQPFDGRLILEKYATFEFGTQLLKELHLSRRFTVGPNGFYAASAVAKVVS